MTLLAQSTCLCKPLAQAGSQARKQSAVSVRAAKRTDAAVPPQISLQQKAAAAAAAAAIFFAPAALAGTPKPPTLGESQSSYAESLQNTIKERGAELKDPAPSGEGDLKVNKKPKPFEQPFTNELGAGNSAKDAGPLFQLGEGQQAPSKPLEAPSQIQDALPDFFQSKPSPSGGPVASASGAGGPQALAAKQTAVDLPDSSGVPNPADAAKKLSGAGPTPGPATSSSGSALAAKETAVELPQFPKLPELPDMPNPADAAKKVAEKAPISAVGVQDLPAKVPPYPAKAAKAGKETAAKSQSPDSKEAAAANQGKLLIGGVLVAGLTLWYTIEKKADPTLGGLAGGSGSPPPSKPSPPSS